jgi:hypothetical protein
MAAGFDFDAMRPVYQQKTQTPAFVMQLQPHEGGGTSGSSKKASLTMQLVLYVLQARHTDQCLQRGRCLGELGAIMDWVHCCCGWVHCAALAGCCCYYRPENNAQ